MTILILIRQPFYKMKKLTASQIWFIFSLIALSITGILFIKLPFRGDERHIVETIKLFADNFNFNTFANYPEVTSPFFFIFYSLWAKIFGASTDSLRLLTLIISFITWQLVFFLIRLFVNKNIYAFLLALLIIVNPYFFGTSIFVFTDMFTNMLILAAVVSFIKNKTLLYFIFSTLAILSRQYAVIIPASVILYSFLNFKNDRLTSRNRIVASLASFLPLLFLFVIWKNISPMSGMEKWVVPNSYFYNFDYINTYVTFSVIYLFPLALIFFIKMKLNYKNFFIALIITVVLAFFPVKPSLATLEQTDYKTVGYIHKAMVSVFGYKGFGLNIVLWTFLFVGCYINIAIIEKLWLNIKTKSFSDDIIISSIWFLFLLIMPLSYQVWEKYLTMVLPFYALSICLILLTTKQKMKTD